MREKIRKFAKSVLEEAETLRESGMELKNRLPIEIMALNAAVNAYEKAKHENAC